MLLDVWEPVWLGLGMLIDTTELCTLVLGNDLDLDSKSRMCKKAETFAPISHALLNQFSVHGNWCGVET